jgi:uncharacterized membrane protein
MNSLDCYGLLGLVITLYAVYVEKYDNSFGNVCNGNSYTNILRSPYARLTKKIFNLPKNSPFNLPNTYYGLIFYSAIILYSHYPFTMVPYRQQLLFGASVASLLISILLGCILYFKLKQPCYICISTYVVNMIIFYYSCYEIYNYK